MSKKIIMAADPFGATLKNSVKEHLISNGYEVIDLGTDSAENFVQYYEISAKAARAVQSGVADRAIVFCGSGMGVAITANKFKGIYCGLIESEYTAEMCKIINNCNVLAMGGKVISETRAKLAVDLWLSKEFAEGFTGELRELVKSAIGEIAKLEDNNFK
jgi:ribose 5-phosphate isomerase B